jgi:hypothetical protein
MPWHAFLGGSTALAAGQAVARDAQGNLYIAGSSNISWHDTFQVPKNPYSGGTDIMVAKFTKDGVLLWNTFLGSTKYDTARAIALDSFDNIYVTGESYATWGSPIRAFQGSDTRTNAFVAKLDFSGNLVWNTFLGGTGDDIGRGIALDGSNNVYVIGLSEAGWGAPLNGFAGWTDAFVAKLDYNGNLLWNTFMGTTSWVYGYGIAVTWGGDVYTTGVSYGSWGSPLKPYMLSSDVFVAKFSSSGSPVWHTFLGSVDRDEGYKVVLDSSENVYVLGGGESTWGSPINIPTGSWSSLLVKLDKNGVLQWNTFFGGSGKNTVEGVVFEGTDNIFVVGYSDASWGTPLQAFSGNRDICLTKFKNNGTLVWNTFLGSSGYQGGNSLAVDPSGNIYFTGFSSATWGSPIAPFTGLYAGFLARMDTNGVLKWNTFFGPSNYDYGRAITADKDGNICVAGYSNAPWDRGSPIIPYAGGESDAFVAKLDPQGALLWHTFLGSTKKDLAVSLATDQQGNIYVTGESEESWGSPKRNHQGGYDVFVAKLDPNGSLLWSTFLGSSQGDNGGGLAVDNQGSVYVVGSSYASWGTPLSPFIGNANIFVAKVSAAGTLLWNTFLGGNGVINYGTGIAMSNPDCIYISGVSGWSAWGTPVTPPAGGIDVFVARLNGNGLLQWNTFLGGTQDDSSFGGIAVDNYGNVLVTGESETGWGTPINPYTPMWRDAFAAKLNANGVLLWNTFLGAPNSDSGNGIAADTNGFVYVTGASYETWGTPVNNHNGKSDAFVAKLTPQGTRLWNTFAGSTDWDEAWGITLDKSGNLFIVGHGSGPWGTSVIPFAGGQDVFVIKLSNPSLLYLPLILGQ